VSDEGARMRRKRRNTLRAALALACLMTVGVRELQSQTPPAALPARKEIAVTVDDLPLNGPRVELQRLRAMTERLVSGFNKYRIPAVGFVNEGLLYVPGETDARISVLKMWTDAGLELGNHTFSHLGFRHTPLARYEDDFVRGDPVTKMLSNQKGLKVRYFRHPFLQMGDTAELEKAFETFIAERGYRIAPVTVDTMDWMFLAAYSKARAAGDAAMLKRVSDDYLKFAALKFDHAERVAAELFGRPVRHILLLHANELNADNFDALVKVLTDRGYRFITLEEALADSVYRQPDKYHDNSDWLGGWSSAKGKQFDSPAPPEYIQKAYADARK
jgi:peptidoglycan/xylan/chitin deacetylase (PgdA/CDA1 family)